MNKVCFTASVNFKTIKNFFSSGLNQVRKSTEIDVSKQISKIQLNIINKNLNKNRKLFFISEHIFFRNSYTNIISKPTTNILYKKHIFDSLSISSIFKSFYSNKKTKYCIDFGTGGGFPGLLLSIFFPRVFISLVDSILRKTNFHVGILNILKLKNCNSICLRGEKISNSIFHRNKYDIVTSRAVAELAELLEIFSTISNSKGKIIIMKKIEGFEKEINNTKNDFSEHDFKVKCLIKVDKKKSGKLVILYKRYRLNNKISNLN